MFTFYTKDADYLLRTLVNLVIFIDKNNFLPLDKVILLPMEADRKKN
jgi:hypothetical protein